MGRFSMPLIQMPNLFGENKIVDNQLEKHKLRKCLLVSHTTANSLTQFQTPLKYLFDNNAFARINSRSRTRLPSSMSASGLLDVGAKSG